MKLKIFLFVLLLLSLLAGGSILVKAGDFPDSWNSRIVILIENSGSKLLDYQVRVEIPYSETSFWSKVQPDAKDVRFVDSDGKTPLYYWISDWDYLNHKMIAWVKIPQIPHGAKVIYLYFNNPLSSGVGWHIKPENPSIGWYAGDGDKTFVFFDDFVSDKGWHSEYGYYFSSYSPCRSINTNLGYVKLEVPSDGHDKGYGDFVKDDVNLSGGNAIEARIKLKRSSSHYNNIEMGVGFRGNTGEVIARACKDGEKLEVSFFYSNHTKKDPDHGIGHWDSDENYHVMDLLWDGERGVEYFDGRIANENLGTIDQTYHPCLHIGYRIYHTTYTDYVFVRKYREKEPKVVSLIDSPSLVKGVYRGYHFELFVDRENKKWLLTVSDKGYTTGWMPFNRLRDTGNFMSGYYADRRYHLLFDWYPSGRCHLIFNDRTAGISIKFAGR